jgi:hypothetical protein
MDVALSRLQALCHSVLEEKHSQAAAAGAAAAAGTAPPPRAVELSISTIDLQPILTFEKRETEDLDRLMVRAGVHACVCVSYEK